MNSSKKFIIIFIFCSIAAFLCNYYIYKYSENFPSRKNEEIIKNTQNYTIEDYENLTSDKLKTLQSVYFGNNMLDKCEIVSKIILDKYSETDIDSLNSLSIIYEEKYDFENSLKYKYRLMPLIETSKLPILYNNMADIYLLSDLNTSLELLEKAIEIDPNNLELNNKLLFFKTLKPYFDTEDKNEYYQKIIEENNVYILSSVIDYIKNNF